MNVRRSHIILGYTATVSRGRHGSSSSSVLGFQRYAGKSDRCPRLLNTEDQTSSWFNRFERVQPYRLPVGSEGGGRSLSTHYWRHSQTELVNTCLSDVCLLITQLRRMWTCLTTQSFWSNCNLFKLSHRNAVEIKLPLFSLYDSNDSISSISWNTISNMFYRLVQAYTGNIFPSVRTLSGLKYATQVVDIASFSYILRQ